jgi:MSHA biogenesis protein MshM
MYESHFGLQEAPFALTPNTRYFLRAPSHADALELLLVALQQREGFIKVTGEVGTGKTLLCRLLLNELDKTACTAYIPNPNLPPETLYEAVAEELGVDVAWCSNGHQILKALNQRLIALAMEQSPAVLVIDEAQAMPEETIEALRFQTRLQPLGQESVGQYLRHRLARAGYNGADIFAPAALKVIWRSSGGIPRLVNVLAHKSMLAAWGRGDRQVARKHALQAVKDTESARPVSWIRRWV